MRWHRPLSLFPVWLLCAAPFLLAQDRGKQYVLQSSHNLSSGSPGPIRASTETQVCVFCHTPHTANPAAPLWNHAGSSVTYNVYSSTTLNAAVPVPAAPSKLCLSCHDGTIALGQTVRNGNIDVVDTAGTLLDPDDSFSSTASPNLGGAAGNNLLNDHPLSFAPVQDGLLVANVTSSPPNPAVPEVKLRNSNVECISCHEPHRKDLDATVQKFLVGDNRSGRLCQACHQHSLANNYWTAASHKTSAKVTPTSPASSWTGYGTVGNDACLACHLPHAATVNQRLLRLQEENTCFLCHGTANRIATYNLQTEFSKVGSVAGVTYYAHPTVSVTPSVHDPAELPAPITGYPRATAPTMPESGAGTARHAECVDCHNPHAANSTGGSTTPPAAQSPLIRVTGVSGTATDGRTPVTPAANQYQICFICHGDSANKPQFNDTGTTGIGYGRNAKRQTDQGNANRYNTRIEFNSTVARHNVVNPRGGTGSTRTVLSLRTAPLNLSGVGTITGRSLASGTYIYCSDCHNNDQTRAYGGTGPNGPHGTIYQHLLSRRYSVEAAVGTPGSTTDPVTWTNAQTTQPLCNMCHYIDTSSNTNAILNNRTFGRHSLHVRDRSLACSDCHDPHGVNGGTSTNNPSLINFDTSIVAPPTSCTGHTTIQLVQTSSYRGNCYMRCHGMNHCGESY